MVPTDTPARRASRLVLGAQLTVDELRRLGAVLPVPPAAHAATVELQHQADRLLFVARRWQHVMAPYLPEDDGRAA